MDNNVTIGLPYEPHQKLIVPQGLDWSQDFKNKIHSKEEELRSKIILEINEFAGDDSSAKFSDLGSPGRINL